MKMLSISKIRFFIFFIKIILIYAWMLVKWLVTPQCYNKRARFVATNDMIKQCLKNIEVVKKPNFDADVIIANHSSFLDILLIESMYEIDVCWVGKSELNGKFGALGVMRYPKNIIVDRMSKSSMLGLIKEAKKKLKENRPIVIFPEGTRSREDKLLPFKDGAKMLAQVVKAKVQPIVLVGIKEALDVKNKKLYPNTKVKIICLETIDVTKKNPNYDTWYSDMHTKMNEIYMQETKKIKKSL